MTEHLTQNQVEAFCRQRLRPAELVSVSDHLGECASCRRRIESAIDGDATFLALRPVVLGDQADTAPPRFSREHPTAEQLAAYVDGILQGEQLQVFADHLTGCDRCVLAVDDLRAFKAEIAPSLEREYGPAAITPPIEGWWQKTSAALTGLFRPGPRMALGLPLTLLLLAATGWLIWRLLPERKPAQEQVVSIEAQPQPPATPTPSAIRVVAQLNDGNGQLTLDQEGKLAGADDLPAAYRNKLREALASRRIEPSPQLKDLTRPPSGLMGSGDQRSEFALIEPVGKVVMSNRPAFRWSPMKGATGYVVEVYDTDFNLVARSPQISGHSWAALETFPRGKVYAWQVTAIRDGQEFKSPRPPAPQARFRVLDQAKANQLASARSAYASSHLTLGLLYAEAGLLAEAEQELLALQKANPDSEIARSLLNQVRGLRRRNE